MDRTRHVPTALPAGSSGRSCTIAIVTLKGKPALGFAGPSTSDVQLSRFLAANLGLREVRVTNGLYTGVVTAENLGRFSTR
jgi:hypothetical protein